MRRINKMVLAPSRKMFMELFPFRLDDFTGTNLIFQRFLNASIVNVVDREKPLGKRW